MKKAIILMIGLMVLISGCYQLNPEDYCNDNPNDEFKCSCMKYGEDIIGCGGYPTVKVLNFNSDEEMEDYIFESRFGDKNRCSFHPSVIRYFINVSPQKIEDCIEKTLPNGEIIDTCPPQVSFYIQEYSEDGKKMLDLLEVDYSIINIIAQDNYAPQEIRNCIKAEPR